MRAWHGEDLRALVFLCSLTLVLKNWNRHTMYVCVVYYVYLSCLLLLEQIRTLGGDLETGGLHGFVMRDEG